MRKSRFIAAALACLLMVPAASALAQKDKELSDKEIKKLPGYVDFESFDAFKELDAKVEVHLKRPMIKLFSEFLKYEDEEAYDLLSKLMLVRVQVFDVDNKMAKKFENAASTISGTLDKDGWERVVRVREYENEHVDIYIRPSESYDSIHGLVVMVVSEDDEAVFINIVGDIRPEDIHRIGEHFKINELEMDELRDINKDQRRRDNGD